MARAESAVRPSRQRGEILASAAELFYNNGYHVTTVQDVARDVGIPKGSLYHYINSKEDLLYELLMDIMLKGQTKVDEVLASTTEPEERLRSALKAHIEHIIVNQVRVGLYLHEFNTLSGARRRRIEEAMRRYQETFVGVVREGQAVGKFTAGDTELMVNGFLGMCNWIYRWYHDHDRPRPPVVQAMLSKMIMRGISKGTEPEATKRSRG